MAYPITNGHILACRVNCCVSTGRRVRYAHGIVQRFHTALTQAHAYVDLIARGLELVGVAIIIFGVIASSTSYVGQGLRTRDWRTSYNVYRANLGRGILLGLELLVGADIMSTVTAPLTFASVGLLAGVIAIRTFLSFSLETEIQGCWPWQRAQFERTSGTAEPPGSR